jgi:GNAT superfamily N-acetyltransferase
MMQLAEMETLTSRDWDELVAGEREPFGHEGEQLTWRNKQRYVGVRDREGRLLAAAGVVLAEVRVGAGTRFPVAGIGGVIVTRDARGRGLGRAVIEAALEIARGLPAERAMLFCLPRNMGLYERFGFEPIEAAVRASQASGTVEMALRGMWAPLRTGASWPDGEVDVLGEPF